MFKHLIYKKCFTYRLQQLRTIYFKSVKFCPLVIFLFIYNLIEIIFWYFAAFITSPVQIKLITNHKHTYLKFMKYLVYVSSASHLLKEDELLAILQVSRRNNVKKGLTGMLLYSEGTFIQLLEGEEDDLKSTYRAIEADDRHKNIIKMTEGNNEQRFFPEWSMGFKSANTDEIAEFKGYINPAGKDFIRDNDPRPVINMLKTFADTNRM